MKIFDFFKFNKKQEKENIEIDFDDLDKWILDKKSEFLKRHDDLVSKIKNKISVFIEELSENIKVLEKIDLRERKAEERVKLIVKDNFDKYVNNLKKLVDNFSEMRLIESKDYRYLITKINHIYTDFEKRSYVHYEKATFLIGNELGKTKEIISKFFRELKEIINENDEFIKTNEVLINIEPILCEIKSIEKLKKESNDNILENTKKIKNIEEDVKKLEFSIDKLKKSLEYIKNIEENNKISEKEKEIEKDIYSLKSLINFKDLSGIFHSDSKKMKLLNEFKDSFKYSFEKSNGESLILLLKDAGLNIDFISEKIESINNKILEINKPLEKSKELENIEELEITIKHKKIEIDANNHENLIEQKKQEKFKEKRESLIQSIRENLIIIDIILNKVKD